MKYPALTREEVISVIEGTAKKESRVPQMIHFWTHPSTFKGREEEASKILSDYPCDADFVPVNVPAYSPREGLPEDYIWIKTDKIFSQNEALDSHVILNDYSEIDSVIENFPHVDESFVLASEGANDGRYRLAHWWHCLFENHWQIRGMENALTDYYLEPESVHKLFGRFTEFYCELINILAKKTNLDGVFLSDDLGHQTGSFFSKKVFNEFYMPYYKIICDTAHKNNLHIWLHACGNIAEFMPELIESGFDVIHPIQKYTMEEAEIAEKYGKQICIWAGMDVQQTIPWGSPDDVRKEVRFMYDTYRKYNAKFMITAGNGITSDCTVESLYAFIDEACKY